MLDGLAVGRDRVTIDADEDLLPRDALDLIEERWWRPIEAQSTIDALRHDDGFVEAPVDSVAPFNEPLDVILREVMSLALAHSESTVPIALFNEPAALRRLVQAWVFTSLDEHRARGASPQVPSTDADVMFEANLDRHDDPVASYSWMVSDRAAHRALVHDVIDGLRVLRAADAIRQRGASLRTAAGEANLRAAMVTADGHLRLALHRGTLEDECARTRAAAATSDVIGDIALDVLPTYDDVAVGDLTAPGLDRTAPLPRGGARRSGFGAGRSDPHRSRPTRCQCRRSRPQPRIHRCPRREGGSGRDRDRRRFTTGIRPSALRRRTVRASCRWILARTGAGLVPVGGHRCGPRAERNATVIAECDLMVVVVPSEVYSAEWFKPLTAEAFAQLFRRETGP